MSEGALFASIEGRGLVPQALADEAFVRGMLRAEASLAAAVAEAGLIPREHAQRIATVSRGPAPTAADLGAEAAATGAPVVPLVSYLRSAVGEDAADSVHLGATTQDIMDTATMLVAAGALQAMMVDLAAAADRASRLAEEHARTPMVGRTLLQQALPTTFGVKAAGWLAGLDQALARLWWMRDERLAVQLGGAAGTLDAYGPHGEQVVRDFAAGLMLPAPALPWHTERSRIIDLAGALGVAAAAVAKPALDIVLMAQTEIAEVSDADSDRGGSSAMPHKRNPVAAVAARACALQAPGLIANLVAAASGPEHERAAGAWHAEWRSLRELLRAVGSAAAWLRDALDHLVVNEERMSANLGLTAGAVAGEPPAAVTDSTAQLVRGALAAHREGSAGRPSPIRVHRVVEGPEGAPVLILANSLGSTLEMWGPQVAELTRRFRVVRYDLRGHGGSPTPPGPYSIGDLGTDVVALLDDLDVPRAHLVGTSIGGMVALWVAANAPDRVDRLVTVGTSARLGPPVAWTERARKVLAGGMEVVAESVVARWYTAGFGERHPDVMEQMREMVRSADPAGYAGCCLAIAGMDQTDTLGAITASTLVVVGDKDSATPPEHAERLVAGIADSRLLELPDAAHVPSLEHPDLVTRLVLEHLGAVTAEAAR